MSDVPTPEPLDPDQAARLTEFARKCSAAARAVALYPAGHPAVEAALARLVGTAASVTATEALRATVLPGRLMIDGRAPATPDAAVTELAVLLNQHHVSGLAVHDAGDPALWERLLSLFGRPPEEIHEAGGIEHLWSDAGGVATSEHLQSVEVREVDYGRLLSSRALGDPVTLDEILDSLGSGEPDAMGPAARSMLTGIVDDAEKLELFGIRLAERSEGDPSAHADALRHLLREATRLFPAEEGGSPPDALVNLARWLTRLDASTLAELLRRRGQPDADGRDAVRTVTDLIAPEEIVRFVSDSIVADQGASQRLAEAFQALVPEIDERRQLVSLVGRQMTDSPFGQMDDFPDMWKRAESLLTSYSDEPYVPEEYAHELSFARTQATEVEQVSDDPPERIASWLSTVDDPSLRSLDRQLLLDLLGLERDPHRWRDIADTVCTHLEDLTLAGDLERAIRLMNALAHERGAGVESAGPESIGQFAAQAFHSLSTGPVLGHLLAQLRNGDDAVTTRVKQLCHTLGPDVVTPLATALAAEGDARVRRAARDILLEFGADGRTAVKHLLEASDWEIRQTAAFLLRDFGGTEGLGELKRLLSDTEPLVQREAIRTLVQGGDERAYQVMVSVLTEGAEPQRDTLTKQLTAQRDERAVPLCRYLLTHLNRARQSDAYLAAIETLGAVGGEGAVGPLRDALYEGEWWSPLQTRTIRQAAAQALRRARLQAATQALRDAVAHGSWGVRAAARAALVQIEGRS